MVSKNAHDGHKYIHAAGNPEVERQRLKDQAEMLRQDIWRNIDLSTHVMARSAPFLEVGAGVAGQTPHIMNALPTGSKLIGIDINAEQISHATANIRRDHPELQNRCSFKTMDATHLDFPEASMSGAYVSWVLEHMPRRDALAVLKELRRVIQKNGVLVINEVHLDPGSSWRVQIPGRIEKIAPYSKRFIEAMIQEQQESLGDPNVGSRQSIGELLTEAGFSNFKYQRIVMHYDQTDPVKLEAYAHYLVALWQSVLPDLIKSGKFTEVDFAKVREELFQASTLRQEAGQVIVNVL